MNSKTERISGFRCTPEFKKQTQKLADKLSNGNVTLLFEKLVIQGYHMTPFGLMPNMINNDTVINAIIGDKLSKAGLNSIYGKIPEGKEIIYADQDSIHVIDKEDK